MVKLAYHTRFLSAHGMPIFWTLARRCTEATYVVESGEAIDGCVGWTARLSSDQLIVRGGCPRAVANAVHIVWKVLWRIQ